MPKHTACTRNIKTKSLLKVSRISSANDKGISKSQQLTRKLQKRKKSTRVPKKSKVVKLCGNGNIMPSLEDLEKMYVDSDECNEQDCEQSCDELPPKKKRGTIQFCNTVFNAQSVEIADRSKKAGNESDSDSTVTYEVPINISTDSHRFSPLPSTSKDREKFFENEKRLNASCEMSPHNYSADKDANSTSAGLQNEKISPEETKKIVETIVLDDEGNYKACKNIEASNNDKLAKYSSSPIIIDDDDDINDISHAKSDIEYNSIDINNLLKHDDQDCEIINIDDVIAENSALLGKYSNSKKINNITHVISDTSVVTIVENDSKPLLINASTINSTLANSHTSNNEPVIKENAIVLDHGYNKNIQIPITPPINVISTVTVDEMEQFPTNYRNKGMSSAQSCNIQSNNSSRGQNQNIPSNDLNSLLGQFLSPISFVEDNTNNLLSKQLEKCIYDAVKKSTTLLGKSQLSSQQNSQPPPKHGFGDCPICMDPFADKPIVATICGHVFCKICMESAIKSSGRKCPTCRMSLKKKNSYHQLFL